MAIAYLSLGSNKGDRIGYVQQAASLLGMDEKITIVRTSAFYESEPWNMNTKNWFVNAIVEIKTQYSPQELLVACQRVECQLGRTPIEKGQYQDRTIDKTSLSSLPFIGIISVTLGCPIVIVPVLSSATI